MLDEHGEPAHDAFGIPPWFGEKFTIEINTKTGKVKISGFVIPKPEQIKRFFEIETLDPSIRIISFTVKEPDQEWLWDRGRAFDSEIGIPPWSDEFITVDIDIKTREVKLTMGDKPFELPNPDVIKAFLGGTNGDHGICSA